MASPRTASARTLARLDALTWVLIYAGLIAIVLGVAVGGESLGTAWSLGIAGAATTAAGVVVLWLRSRLREEREPLSPSKPTQGKP